jgi:predicted lysophospholipase L1 biosynthesis ABC-type transport system permease subunit
MKLATPMQCSLCNVERRTREIGIRKALGAEIMEIITLLVWQFSELALMANIFAWSLGVWAMLGCCRHCVMSRFCDTSLNKQRLTQS